MLLKFQIVAFSKIIPAKIRPEQQAVPEISRHELVFSDFDSLSLHYQRAGLTRIIAFFRMRMSSPVSEFLSTFSAKTFIKTLQTLRILRFIENIFQQNSIGYIIHKKSNFETFLVLKNLKNINLKIMQIKISYFKSLNRYIRVYSQGNNFQQPNTYFNFQVQRFKKILAL